MSEDEFTADEMVHLDNSLIFDPNFGVREVAGVIPPCKECDHAHCQIQREQGDYVIASSLTRKLKTMRCGKDKQHGRDTSCILRRRG